MRVAVVGCGAIGCYLGGRLLESGCDVTFFARGKTFEALCSGGLSIESHLGDVAFERLKVTDDVGSIGAVDLVVVAVKAWDMDAALAEARPLLGEETMLLTTQNGVEAPLKVVEIIGKSRTIVGLFRLPCVVVEPGHVKHIGGHVIQVGALEESHFAARIEELSTALGTHASIPEDIFTAMWDKMVGMAVTTGVGAVTRAPLGILFELSELRDLVLRAAREATAVARAHGARLADDYAETRFGRGDHFSRSQIFSTQRDIMMGRPSELDSQITAISRLGRQLGVPTPIFDFIYTVLLPQELKARGELSFDCT